ncbi:MAG: hypothetical protein V2J07_01245 [Anaerolineae bacterium]|jgi:hypothetical protein|nr:hypothetical protein [Anaerolineae bacterium]
MNYKETIQQLLNIMLNTILNSSPYPGQDVDQTFFPDIELVKDNTEIYLSEKNLHSACCFEVPGYTICIIPEDELSTRAVQHGDFPYLALSEVQRSGNTVTLTLQLKWAISKTSQEMGKFYMSGGGVRVKFIYQDGEWISPDGPMATWMS